MALRTQHLPPPKATILIVEDHADTRDAMGLVLATLGCNAIVAASGAEALTILHRTRPDLVFCDVRMPGMDGFDFAKAMRRLPGGAGLKLVAVTGVSDRTLATRLLAAGFDGHLVKPLDFERLRDTLDGLLWMPRTARPRVNTRMAAVRREPSDPAPPPPACVRCSKPITPGTASQYAGRPVHMRCLSRDTQLESIEQQDRAAYERSRAHAAMVRARELMDVVRRTQTRCPACGEPLATSRGVLFRGDELVHATCWRDEPKPFGDSSPTRPT